MDLSELHIPMRAVAVTPQVWLGKMDARASKQAPNDVRAAYIQQSRDHRVVVGSTEDAVDLLVLLGASTEHAERQVRTALVPPGTSGVIPRHE